MKKQIAIFLVLCFLVSVVACGKNTQTAQVSLAPTRTPSLCMLNDKLLFNIQGKLLLEDTDNGALTLKPLEEELAILEYGSSIQEAGKDAVYLVKQETTMSLAIEKLSANGEIATVCTLSDVLRDEVAPVVSEDICYYVKGMAEGTNGFGRTLKMFPLTDVESQTTLYVWKNMDPQDYLSGLRSYGQYLVMVYNIGGQNTLWVYDTKKQEMIIEGDGEMSEAACLEEKLYYIDDNAGTICSYDLANVEQLDMHIPISDYGKGATLACDKDYLYVNHVMQVSESYENNSSKISIYSYDGNLMDTLDLAENADALQWDIQNNPFYCVYLGSTEDYIFIGNAIDMGLSAIFYVEKADIGAENMTIHTLYLHKNELESY